MPSAPVFSVSDLAVSLLVNVTLAFGTDAPETSVTVPEMPALNCACPILTKPAARHTNKTERYPDCDMAKAPVRWLFLESPLPLTNLVQRYARPQVIVKS